MSGSTYNTNLRCLHIKKSALTSPGRVDGAEPLYEGTLCTGVPAPVVTGDLSKLWAGYVLHLQVFNNTIIMIMILATSRRDIPSINVNVYSWCIQNVGNRFFRSKRGLTVLEHRQC